MQFIVFGRAPLSDDSAVAEACAGRLTWHHGMIEVAGRRPYVMAQQTGVGDIGR